VKFGYAFLVVALAAILFILYQMQSLLNEIAKLLEIAKSERRD